MPPASILIVEDEAVVALDLKMELEALGYGVAGMADTAEEALRLARQHRPALVLMDIMLKGRLDGIEAAAALRQDPGSPVVFLTSFSDSATVQRAAQTGAYGYLTKPFQMKELRAAIEVALWKSQLERQLRESDRWFALTLRCVQDAVIVVDAQARIRFINPAGETLIARPREAVLGHPVAGVVLFDEQGEGAQTLVLRALRDRCVMGVRHARRLLRPGLAHALVDESAGPIEDEHGAGMGAVLVMRDASERVQQVSLLRASEERFRSAFELAPLGMALVSLPGRFLQVNAALCRLLHCDAPWLLQQTFAAVTERRQLGHEATRLAELHDGHHAVTQFETRLARRHGGATVSVLVNASLLTEPGGLTCHLFQVHDLTAQQEAAAQVAELAAERLKRENSELLSRSKSEFLSRVSHEMRTPLNAVLGFAQLLAMQENSGRTTSGPYAEHILNAGKHLLALVNDVLDLQRATDGKLSLHMQPTELAPALLAAIDLLVPLADARAVKLSHRIEPGLWVSMDGTRLQQVLLNLGSNAIKYNVQGGAVDICASRRPDGQVQISVEDTGIGMTPEQMAHLFEPFNRLGREKLKIAGVGLGLVITRELVERMGGRVTVGTGAGGGTRFELAFAAAAA